MGNLELRSSYEIMIRLQILIEIIFKYIIPIIYIIVGLAIIKTIKNNRKEIIKNKKELQITNNLLEKIEMNQKELEIKIEKINYNINNK